MSRLFIAYLGSLMLRSIGIAVIAGICSWKVRNVAIRHAVWVTVLVAMVLMPAVDYILPPAWVPSRIHQIVSDRSETLSVVSEATADLGPQTTSAASSPPAPLASPVPSRRFDLWQIAFGLYALVALAMFGRLTIGYRNIWALRRAAKWIPDAECQQFVEDLRPRWRVPVLLECDRVQVPMTIGLFRPSILLPASWQHWEPWKLQAVLLHETTHIRRCDWGFAALAALARCVYWFNPLPWYLERKLSELAEHACDDASVSRTRNTTQYAEILLEFAAAAQDGGRFMKRGIAMAQHKIQSRIERILGSPNIGNGVLKLAGWSLVIMIAVPVIYSAAAVQVASQSATAPIPVTMVRALPPSASLQATVNPEPGPQSAPAVATPPKVERSSPAADLRDLFEIEKASRVQQEVELLKAIAAGEVPSRVDWAAAADVMKAELMKVQAQMKVLEAQRDAEKMKLSQSAITPESASAIQSRLAVLDARQREMSDLLVEVQSSAARQSEFERQKRTVSADEYQMRSGDIISVFVFGHAELSKERVLVQPDGRISIPLVQSLPAAGLTSTELKAAVESRLKESIYYPNVTVMIESVNVERR